jgi:hypothetical protein
MVVFEADVANPPPLQSHIPSYVLSLDVKPPPIKQDAAEAEAVRYYRRAADFIAAGRLKDLSPCSVVERG